MEDSIINAKSMNAATPIIIGNYFVLYFLRKKINITIGKPIEINADINIKTIENPETCI
jgi:hypothetical protein